MKHNLFIKARWLLCTLFAVFLITPQVWGETYVVYPDGGDNLNTAWEKSSSRTAKQTINSKVVLQLQAVKNSQYGELISKNTLTNITEIKVNATANKNKSATLKLLYSSDKTNWTDISTTTSISGDDSQSYNDYTLNIEGLPSTSVYIKLQNSGSSNSVYLYSITITTSTGGGETGGRIEPNPTSVEVAAEGVDEETISVTYTNISDVSTKVDDDIKIYADADLEEDVTNTIDWLTAIWNDDKDGVVYTISANTGAARTAYIYLNALDDNGDAVEVVIPVTQAKYTAPTGTFEKFTDEIEEGDYVIMGGTYTLGNTISNSRFVNGATVTVSDNTITNPDESIIWHIAASGDYWTMYNEAAGKYASATTAKNQGDMVDATSDNHALWTITAPSTGSDVYTFENVGRASDSDTPDNRYLRNNTTFGWAAYSSGYGNGLTLYKKSVPVAVKKPTFSVAGGSYLDAQNVELSCATEGATIYYTLDGTDPTASSTEYTAAIAISETKTLKAIAIKGDDKSAIASATYTIVTPLTVADAIALIPNTDDTQNDQYVEGYVCTAGTSVSSGQMTYYISADGTESDRLQVYYGKNLNNTNFSAVSDLAIGDKVIVYGQLKNYQGKPELNSGNYIKRYTAKGALTTVVVSGTPTKKEYSANETFETVGLIVTATYENGYKAVVTDGITWNDDLTDHKVTATGTVAVTAKVGEITSAARNVDITVSSKTLESIALSQTAYEVYQGQALPKPTVTATYSEGEDADVTAEAEFTGYDASTVGEQTITVTYSFGGVDKTETYTITVKSITDGNDINHPYSVAEAFVLIGTEGIDLSSEVFVAGIVSKASTSLFNSKYLTYTISDDGETSGNQLKVYNGLNIDGAAFASKNDIQVKDEVIVKGKLYNFNSTYEINSDNVLQSLVRTPAFSIEDVEEFEIGSADLALSDLDVIQDGEGTVTLASDDETVVAIVDNKLHAVAAGNATITATLAANGIYKEVTTTFAVKVIAAQVKYAISFDSNGADGGEAPEAIADKVENATVTLPANAWTKDHYVFDGWKVINNTTSEEVTVTDGQFTMPASAVTVQAQWAELPVWAYTFTSNVEVGSDKVIINSQEHDAKKAGTNKDAGSTTVTIPEGATKLHFHAAAWKGETVVLTVKNGETELTTCNLYSDEGVKESSPFTLQGNNYSTEQYFVIAFSPALTEETTLTFAATSGKRFVLYGVNQEGGVEPASIEVSATTLDFGRVEQNEAVEAKTVNVTLTNVANATVTLTGDVAAFSINQTSLTETGTITVTPNTTEVGSYTATLTISDDANDAESKEVTLKMTVKGDYSALHHEVTDLMAQGFANQEKVTAIEGNTETITFAKGDGSTEPAYYTTGNAIRMYSKNTLTIESTNGKNIVSVDITFAATNYAASEENTSVSEGTYTLNGVVGTISDVNATSVILTNTMSQSGHFRIQKIHVWYADHIILTDKTTGQIGTLCQDKNIVAVEGGAIYRLLDGDANSIEFEAIETAAAGQPVVWEADEEEITVIYGETTSGMGEGVLTDAVAYNGLVGLVAGTYNFNYGTNDFNGVMIHNGHLVKMGQYIQLTGGHAVIDLGKINSVAPAPGRRRLNITAQPQMPTGIEAVETQADGTRKVIVNGVLYIVSEGKTYNVQGQIVK